VDSLEAQAAQFMRRLRSTRDALERYVRLAALQNENEALFYRLLLDHPEELLPVVYTPTVGEACLAWGRIQSGRGLYLSARDSGRMREMLRNWPGREARIVVVTDGSRILGLGDLGAHGMAIPIGKLVLYTACGGIPPALGLPVTLDVGTNNAQLRNDPCYAGLRSARLQGAAWDALLDEFVSAVQNVFPGAVLHFEDFSNAAAFALLERYRERLCCFNDDIQGTGAMGLAGLRTACRVTGSALAAQRLLFVGAGEACLGIGAMVVAAMRREGLGEDEARRRCLFFDSQGAVVTGRPGLAPHKQRIAQARPATDNLLAAIETFRPGVLIGACARPGIFSEPVLAAMARHNERPVVFALSNPNSRAECSAVQAYGWTNGRVLFAAGSPFPPLSLAGRELLPSQANNAWIFPGVGLGLLLSGARLATEDMFLAAAQALASQVTDADLDAGRLFPAPARTREVAADVAAAVAEIAYAQGHASRPRPACLRSAARQSMYQPG